MELHFDVHFSNLIPLRWKTFTNVIYGLRSLVPWGFTSWSIDYESRNPTQRETLASTFVDYAIPSLQTCRRSPFYPSPVKNQRQSVISSTSYTRISITSSCIYFQQVKSNNLASLSIRTSTYCFHLATSWSSIPSCACFTEENYTKSCKFARKDLTLHPYHRQFFRPSCLRLISPLRLARDVCQRLEPFARLVRFLHFLVVGPPTGGALRCSRRAQLSPRFSYRIFIGWSAPVRRRWH